MGWQWHQQDHMQIICTLLQTDNHTSTSSINILQARCSFCHPTKNNNKTIYTHVQLVLEVRNCRGNDNNNDNENLLNDDSHRVFSTIIMLSQCRLVTCKQETFEIMLKYVTVIWEAVPDGWASYNKTQSVICKQFDQWDNKLVTVSGSERE